MWLRVRGTENTAEAETPAGLPNREQQGRRALCFQICTDGGAAVRSVGTFQGEKKEKESRGKNSTVAAKQESGMSVL